MVPAAEGKSFIDLYSHNLTMHILVDIYEDFVEYYVQVWIITEQTKDINCAGEKGQFSHNDCL